MMTLHSRSLDTLQCNLGSISTNYTNVSMLYSGQLRTVRNVQPTLDRRMVYYQSMNVILHLNICYVLVC